jgi:hypothetical protein
VLVASMWVLGVRRIRTLILVASVTSAMVYLLLIRLVSSRLPQGPGEWLMDWIIESWLIQSIIRIAIWLTQSIVQIGILLADWIARTGNWLIDWFLGIWT